MVKIMNWRRLFLKRKEAKLIKRFISVASVMILSSVLVGQPIANASAATVALIHESELNCITWPSKSALMSFTINTSLQVSLMK